MSHHVGAMCCNKPIKVKYFQHLSTKYDEIHNMIVQSHHQLCKQQHIKYFPHKKIQLTVL